MTEQDNQIVETIAGQPVKFELSTNAKGQHQWTLSIQGTSPQEIIDQLVEIDGQLQEKYKHERV